MGLFTIYSAGLVTWVLWQCSLSEIGCPVFLTGSLQDGTLHNGAVQMLESTTYSGESVCKRQMLAQEKLLGVEM